MSSESDRESSFCLVGLSKELSGKRFELSDGATLGRAVNASVFLPDPALGRQHARFEESSLGPALINCSHDPGLVVNGHSRRRHLLRNGDVVKLGRFELRFEVTHNHATVPETRPQSVPLEDCSTDELSRGIVLTIRLVGSTSQKAILPLGQNLWTALKPLVESAGGRLFQQDQLQPRIVFRDRGKSSARALHSAVKVTQAVHRLAFLATTGQGGMGVAVGLAAGSYREIVTSDFMGVWGGAADESLRLALNARVHDTLMANNAHPPISVKGYQGEGEGRRQKLVLAHRCWIAGFNQRFEALIIRINFDPETGLTLATVLCRSPIEMNEDYQLGSPNGARAFRSRSFDRLPDGIGTRVQFSGRHSLESVSEWLGLQVPLQSPLLTHSSIQPSRPLAA